MIWRHTGIGICRTCRSSSVVPYVARKEKLAAPQETVFKAVQPSLSEDEDRVRCPECLELVLSGAKKCKHCGSHLSAGSDGVLKVAHGDLGSIGVFDWWLSAFTAEEKEYIKGKFKPMGGLVDGESSVNQCAHVYLESMQSHFRDKKDEVVFFKIDEKIQSIVNEMNIDYDRELYKTDDTYRAWFFNRSHFFYQLDSAKRYDFAPYFLWSPVSDNRCPEECEDLNGKVFRKDDPKFVIFVNEHWRKVRRGCRCSIILISDHHLEMKGLLVSEIL